MYCSNCGQELPENANVCPYCGELVKYMQPPQLVSQPQIIDATTGLQPTSLQPITTGFPCPNCGFTGDKKKVFRTSTFLLLFCCLCGLIGCVAATIYAIATSGKLRCPQCKFKFRQKY
ncbi:MAG: zinc-ribbon domain-containing protein [Promethearchaeota archaeon]